MAQRKKSNTEDLFDRARGEFDRSYSASEDERCQCLEDRTFYAVTGGQWGGKWGEAYKNKVKLELNKVNWAVYRVINEWRGNSVTADFLPKDGSVDDELSDLCDGLMRADEQDSAASEAFAVAFEEQCSGGFGAWRLTTEYEDEFSEDDDRQRIRFEPIYDADQTVFFDANARKYDKSDAKHCFVLSPYTKEAFEEEFDEDPSDWGKPDNSANFEWFDGDNKVYVAEYYVYEVERYKVLKFKPAFGDVYTVAEEDLTEEDMAKKDAVGDVQIGEKMVKRQRVRKYILSGSGILEDCGYIAGRYIPVVPVYGKRSFVDGVERYSGVVRFAKDAQRLYNMQASSLADIASRASYRKPIFNPEQIPEYLMGEWETDAEKNHAFLRALPAYDQQGNVVSNGGPVGEVAPPEVPPTTAALLQLTGQDIADILGNQEVGEEVDPSLSGKAVELIQSRMDQHSVIYNSNFAESVRHSGKIWLSMASEVYSEDERRMKVVDKSGAASSQTLNDVSVFGPDGLIVRKNDLSRAAMDIVTDIGPTSSTKRSATVRTLSSMVPLVQDPMDKKVITAMIMISMEGEGLGDFRDYFRGQMVKGGVIKPTEEEEKQMAEAQAAQQPSAQDEYLLSEAQKNAADTEKSQAQTIESMAKAEKAKAEAAQTLASIQNSQRDSVVNAVNKLSDAGTMPPQNGMR